MQKTKGFTLIELLVVIAIIGILSGLIIVSMSGAQNAAKDARIKAAIDQFRSVAEIYKVNNGGYGATAALTACTVGATTLISSATSEAKALCDDIQAQGTGALQINLSSTAYCINKVLPGGGTWCLDSAGVVGCIGTTNCSTSVGAGCSAGADYSCI